MVRKNSAHNMCAHVLISFVTIFAASGAMAANSTSTAKPAITNYARPLSFEPNRGQRDKQVDFLAHGAGYSLFLSHAEAVIVLQRGAPAKRGSHSLPTPLISTAVRLKPVGGNASAPVGALGELPGKSNYFIGSVPERWHTGIPNYAKVRYRNVYRGVDMIYYGNQRQLEYDFVVSPGADPGRISLEFQGASKAELDREGIVVMHTAAGDLRWHKPIAYQEVNGSRKLVECAYARRGPQLLGFALADYDRAKPLIIDPVLDYSTYLGGSGADGDQGMAIAVDAYGNAYVTGFTASPDFPTKNAFQNKLKDKTGDNAFVTKFNTVGELVYSTYLGGSGNPLSVPPGDFGVGIAVDRKGHAYVTGETNSPDFPTKNAFQGTLKSSSGNAFVTKLDVDGDALVYSTYLGGSQGLENRGNAIAVNAHGNAYVTGFTRSTDFPTKNAFQHMLGGPSATNAFLTKFDADGDALVYSTYLGGSEFDMGHGIAVGANGSAYVTGETVSPDFPITNAFPAHASPSTGGAFVTKFDADGDALVYSTFLRGGASFGIAVGANGSAYVTGEIVTPDFPTKNAFQKSLRGAANAFVTRLDAAGDALVYSTYLGGSSFDLAGSIAVDAEGNAYVTGGASSCDFPIKNAFQKRLKGSQNAFVTKFDADGDALVYSSYLGGSNLDAGFGIALDAEGNAYVTGFTSSTNFPTKNAFQPMLGGPSAAQNVFVTKISAH
jgi:hypothetical protein